MSFYRVIMVVCIAGNLGIFASYMIENNVEWGVVEIVFGLFVDNIPIILASLAAEKTAQTLKGHWLNWINVLNPIVVGALGFYLYGVLASQPEGYPVLFMLGPILLAIAAMFLKSIVFVLFTFVGDTNNAPTE